MTIQEATKQSMEMGTYIRRKNVLWQKIKLKPTNTPDGCIAFKQGNPPRKGWQPKAEDLMAEDWIVVD